MILGFGMITSTFSSGNPIGKSIVVNGRPFQIIGIFDKTGDYSVDQNIFIPFSLAKKQFGVKNINRIEVSLIDITGIPRVKKQISYILDKFFSLSSSQIYHLETNDRFLEEVQKSINSMTLFIVGIAAISLFVGGIGIMNVMLVSVTERTREIGIRKAIGATRYDIMIQFLIESGTITCIGGIIAIILSYAIGYSLVEISPSFAFSIDITIVLLAAGFSVLMGVIFGLLPAWKAARMKPVDALRFE
jgi:putative ABC transport system permease protein